MNLQRRNFIKLSATVQAMMMVPSQVFALFRTLGTQSCPENSSKKLVLIQLDGANDGLNTLVPINQYDLYSNLRPDLKLNLSGTNKVINLDTTLPIEAQVGLHPSLSGFKNLYDAGLMRIIQGVGYPNQDKSHFKSTDLWMTGGDGTTANNTLKSGWMGRFLERYYDALLTAGYPLGLQFGSSNNALGFHGAEHAGLSMNLNNQDLNGYYSIINGLGGEPPATIPSSEYGDLIQYILQNDANTNVHANAVTTAFTSGSNTGIYPSTFLGNQLKTVARLISGGLKTKIYLVRLGGFDTHDSQVEAGSPHLGNHAILLLQVSEAIKAFITDLNTQNLGQETLAMTFSEFGRKIKQNDSLGKDHGEVAPMFLFGSMMAPGISGTNINLQEATSSNNYQVETVQFDYRRVYATVLQDWLGASSTTLNHTLFDNTQNTGFASQKLTQILKPAHVVPPVCYGNSVVSTSKPEESDDIKLYPNAAYDNLNIESSDNVLKVRLIDLNGRTVKAWYTGLDAQQVILDVSQIPAGLYVVQIKTSTKVLQKKVMIRR
jgi:uncharacterized protein (DUF1501 family)